MAFLPAGFIDGTTVYGETLRRAFWIATQGASGIATPDDLAVTALASPGAAVNIAPGGGAITTAFANAPTIQTYTVANDATYQLGIPANATGSPVTWQVIVRITDGQYAGEPTGGNGTPIVEAVQSFPTGKPYLWLATVTVPANTAVVTNSNITDRRTLARARRERQLEMRYPAANSDMATGSYANWPSTNSSFTLAVPVWARSLKIVASYSGVETVGSAASPAVAGVNAYINDTANGQNGIMIATSNGRQTFVGGWKFSLASSVRGTNVTLDLKAVRTSTAGNFQADYQTTIVVDYEFSEKE